MILESISRYLQLGGLFNPELMDHAKVRDMIIACRDRIEALEAERDEYRRFATHWHSQCQAVATVLSLPEPEGTNHAECVRSAFEAAEAREARLSEALRGATASLVAAVSLLKRGSKKAAPSDKMFDQMILDYEKSIEEARAALSGSGSGWRDGLSTWAGWDQSREPWGETKHKDAVLEAMFRGPWSAEDADALIGFIDRTWTPLPVAPQQGGE